MYRKIKRWIWLFLFIYVMYLCVHGVDMNSAIYNLIHIFSNVNNFLILVYAVFLVASCLFTSVLATITADFYSTIFIQENIMWQIFAFFFLYAILHVRKQDKYTHLTSELTWWDSLAFQPFSNRLIPFKVCAL